MSKRLQVVLPDDEYRDLARAARKRGASVSELVRQSLRRALAERPEPGADERIAAVLRFARFAGPTGDIEQILAEIEKGRTEP